MKSKLTILLTLFLFSIGNAQSNLQFTTACEDISECLDENCNLDLAVSTITVEATTDCTSSPFLLYTYSVDLNSNGFTDIVGSFNQFTFPNEVGIHQVIFEVSDQCGSVISCESIVEVKDCIAPVINCFFNLLPLHFPFGDTMLVMDANEFPFANASDNCDDSSDLIYSFSENDFEPTITFTCVEIFQNNGILDLELYVTDQSGNQSSCMMTIQLFDISGDCNLQLYDTIPVCVTLPDLQPINDFRINNVILGNDPDSDCKLFIPQTGFTTITPSRITNPINGINLLDLILLRKHILLIQPFDNPYKILAGDLNNSFGISTFDMILMNRIILKIDNSFSSNIDAWNFVDATYDIPANGFGGFFPNFIEVANIDTTDFPLEFIAFKVGDVDCSVDLTEQTDGLLKTPVGTFTFCVEDKMLTAGDTVLVPIKAYDFDNIAGFILTTTFDTSKLIYHDILPNEININAFNFNLNNADIGILGGAWADPNVFGQTIPAEDSLFFISFIVSENVLLSDAFAIDGSFLALDAYDINDDRVEVDFEFCNTVATESLSNNSGFVIGNNPNPFSDITHFRFYLSQQEAVTLYVFDVNGQLLKTEVGNFSKGEHSFLLEKNDLPTSGIYFYQLKMEESIHSGKILFQEK